MVYGRVHTNAVCFLWKIRNTGTYKCHFVQWTEKSYINAIEKTEQKLIANCWTSSTYSPVFGLAPLLAYTKLPGITKKQLPDYF
jgi:hypothetical protein